MEATTRTSFRCLATFSHTPQPTQFWYQKLAPYIVKAAAAQPGNTEAYTTEVRKCPAGRLGPPPFAGSAVSTFNSWNCWVGVYYGLFGNPLTGPFYYGNEMKPIASTRIAKPSDAMMYMDTVTPLRLLSAGLDLRQGCQR